MRVWGVSSITNADGDATALVTLTDGSTADLALPTVAAPSFTAGTVTTVPAGGVATASVSGTYPDLRLNFGLVTGQPDDYRIVGAGRPDVAGSMSSDIAARVAAAPVGCEFRSTDGAGVGAWAWQKTPTGWVITMGDTGWRKLDFSGVPELDPAYGFIAVRRLADIVYFNVSDVRVLTQKNNTVIWPYANAVGFRGSGRVNVPLYETGGTVTGTLYWRYDGYCINSTAGYWRFNLLTTPTTDKWPLTRPGTPYNQ